MPDRSFLGRGMKFPPQVNAATGRIETASEEESVRQSVYLILTTQVSERPMRPEYGSNIMDYTFLDVNPMTINLISRTIKDQIMSQEPRVSDLQISVDADSRPGVVRFDIGYLITDMNTRDNVVFPFYLNGESIEQEGEAEVYEPETMETNEY